MFAKSDRTRTRDLGLEYQKEKESPVIHPQTTSA